MRRAITSCAIGLLLSVAGAARAAVATTLPTPDHVVVVIEENQPASSITGYVGAPYLNTLASGGARLDDFYAITHPSQPNYLGLFSGSTQGVTDDNQPAKVPFTTPNLAAALKARGLTFTGYSESLPSAGYDGGDIGLYARKHNPWTNWQSSSTPATNQLSPAVNQPFSVFPKDFSLLPKVSMVVPNLVNDMHDGSIAAGDAWLKTNLDAYTTWAKTHNSMLIVTWDEDDGSAGNRIDTILSGPMITPGARSTTRYGFYDLLRTVGDMYGVTAPGGAASASDIAGIWKQATPPPPPLPPPPPPPPPPPKPATSARSFRMAVGGYTGGHDTYLNAALPNGKFGTVTPTVAGGAPANAALVRFDSLIGTSATQIPAKSKITSAKLTLKTSSGAVDGSAVHFSAYRMLKSWSESSTWNSLINGVTPNGTDSVSLADSSIVPGARNGSVTFDVTRSLQAWSDGASDFGWAILPSATTSNTDAWRWLSDEYSTVSMRPMLEVSFTSTSGSRSAVSGFSAITTVPEPASAIAAAGVIGLLALRRHRRRCH